jgi:hypothetical protein
VGSKTQLLGYGLVSVPDKKTIMPDKKVSLGLDKPIALIPIQAVMVLLVPVLAIVFVRQEILLRAIHLLEVDY